MEEKIIPSGTNITIPKGAEPNQCPYCEMKFRYKNTLRNHMSNAHTGNERCGG